MRTASGKAAGITKAATRRAGSTVSADNIPLIAGLLTADCLWSVCTVRTVELPGSGQRLTSFEYDCTKDR